MVYKLVGKIVEIKGICHVGHEVGEVIDLTVFDENGLTKKGIELCPFFLDSLFSCLCVMQFGGRFPWEEDPNVLVACCPDLKNRAKIRIERILISVIV